MTERLSQGENLHITALDPSQAEMAARIYQLFQRSYRVEAELVGITPFPPLERTANQIQTHAQRFLGCWEEDCLAAAVEYEHQTESPGGHLSIHSLVVDPSYFRQGVASRLLAHLLTDLRWRSACVETAAANQPAIALYQKFGFVLQKRWRTSHGIDKVQLSLQR